jgi:flagellar hook-associated protein 3 FlgL
MANDISTLAAQINSIRQLKNIQTRMFTYQEQISTGVKYQTFSEYGVEASRIMTYRSEISAVDAYLYNIEVAQNTIVQMDSAITETSKQAQNVLKAMSIQLTKGSGIDVEAIKSAAASALQIVEANMNVKIGDKYLFAGTDVSNEPYANPTTATSNVQTQITNWLNGTTTTDDFLTGVDNLTDSQLGYSVSIQTSKNIFVRADDSLEVDYTVKANDEGFKKIIRGLTAIANIKKPETGDVATDDNFFDALNSFYRTIQDGIEDLRSASVTISSSAQIIDSIKANHLDDKQNLQQMQSTTEATDTTDAVVKFQTLQTQLDASYRVTLIVSQLSLARLLG